MLVYSAQIRIQSQQRRDVGVRQLLQEVHFSQQTQDVVPVLFLARELNALDRHPLAILLVARRVPRTLDHGLLHDTEPTFCDERDVLQAAGHLEGTVLPTDVMLHEPTAVLTDVRVGRQLLLLLLQLKRTGREGGGRRRASLLLLLLRELLLVIMEVAEVRHVVRADYARV